MRAYGAIMAESARRAAAAWTSGVPFKMLETMQGISLDVIVQAVMGFDHTTPHGQAVRQAILQFMGSLRPQFIFCRWLRRDFFGYSFLERKFSAFEHIPFGGGARRCIGAAFALYEMKIVLATILRSHRLRLVSAVKVSPVRRAGTTGPSDGIPMVYEGAR